MVITTGKCPNCQEAITTVEVEPVTVQKFMDGSWNGISYLCPACRTVLSVQIDPVALQADAVKEILDALGKG